MPGAGQARAQAGKSTRLRDALERQVGHQVYDVRLLQEALLKLFDGDREGGRVQHDLALWRQEPDQLLHNRLELL